ncbi:MAG: hypothetical protein ACI8P3_002872 [Saprospiraceae bacterium]|jgi:hypothetical protein
MKKIFSLVIFFAMVFSISYAQTDASAPTSDENGAMLKFETVVIDYGEIEQGSDPLRVFNFENVGEAPAIIKNAKGSCGCTVPLWPKEPIMMGEKNKIEVRYDTKRIGKFTKTVKLTTNYSDSPIVLTIKGTVNKKEAEPEGIPENTPSILNGGK